MKGKIIVLDSEGVLMIERGNQMRVQSCPFQSMRRDYKVPNYNDIVREPVARPCGDWCPLFGEPIKTESSDIHGNYRIDGGAHLSLCQTHYYFDQFTDERVGGDDKEAHDA